MKSGAEEWRAPPGAAGTAGAGTAAGGAAAAGPGGTTTGTTTLAGPRGSLVAEGLRYAVAGRTILDGVDLEVAAGETLAITGPSGSGKTTLMLVLAGLLPPDEGKVRLDGPPADAPDRQAIVLQTLGLAPALTAIENVALPLQARRMQKPMIRRRSEEALESLGLTASARQLAETLSGGQQQRVAIARALAGEPFLLLADEPTAELDADNRERAMNLFLARAAAGSIVVIATHDMEVAEMCRRIVRIGKGQLTEHVPDAPA